MQEVKTLSILFLLIVSKLLILAEQEHMVNVAVVYGEEDTVYLTFFIYCYTALPICVLVVISAHVLYLLTQCSCQFNNERYMHVD